MATGRNDGTPNGNGRTYAAKAEQLDADRRRVESAERERDDLWQWMDQLERLAETGLHARGLAHDMGNALTSLMANCELALMQDSATEYREALERGLEVTRKAAQRLQAFMEYTRRGEDERHPISVSEVAHEAERFLSYPIRKGQIRVDYESDGRDRVVCSRPHLLQVLSTAMLNLVRGADPSGATIEVDVRTVEDDVRVDVRRNAPGPAAAPPSAGAPANRSGVTGLELALSRRILQRIGGRIEVFGGDIGPVCFRIVLPTAGAAPTPDLEAEGGYGETETRNRAHIWKASAASWSPHGRRG